MNQQQKKYAVNRIDGLMEIKERELRKCHTTPAIKLSFDKKLDLIFSSKVKFIPRKKIERYTYFVDAFDFSEHERESSFPRDAESVLKQIRDIGADAKDQLMLGDADKALKLIKQLESIATIWI